MKKETIKESEQPLSEGESVVLWIAVISLIAGVSILIWSLS